MVVLAVLAAVPLFTFGRDGGNLRPAHVTISATGVVRRDSAPTGRTVKAAALQDLEALARRERFSSMPVRSLCAGTLPDFSSRYVTFKGRTVHVRGSCSARFNKLYGALSGAAGTG
jgi:hypothetical protein